MRNQILDAVRKYTDLTLARDAEFIAGETRIRTSGAVWEADDVASLVDVALSRWYAGGRTVREFERLFAASVEQRYAVFCNSGSSANLLAIACLTSKRLKDKALKRGDEVITVAAGFPTTVNPIVQNGLVPVFVDINLPRYNALPHVISEAITEKTRAIFMAHTLGNPYHAKEIRDIADQNELFVIADCCDALGGKHHGKQLPYWADISTFSFFPAHHISTGEGGAVTTNDSLLYDIVRSFRDWGRACWCDVGQNGACGKRFGWKLGDLPHGFDHKYTYTEIGYNLKATDLQAALGISQLKKIGRFAEIRRDNWNYYRERFDEFEKYFILPEPTSNSEPSWFGFVVSVRDTAPFTRAELVRYLDENKIDTRMLFAGNLTRHPAYKDAKYRISGTLRKTDFVTNNTFWIGIAPVVTRPMQEYVVEKVSDFLKGYE